MSRRNLMMSNHPISHDKTVYDLFNMINPNCYQAFIIQYIIENRKEEAIKCCDELSVAFNYYKWDSKGKQSNYIDALICESNLAKWQKIAIIHIIANDVASCKKSIESEIENEKAESVRRVNAAKNQQSQLRDLCNLFGFNSLL